MARIQEAPTAEAIPSPAVDLSIDYLKLGDSIFAITKVGDGIDIHREVKTFYEEKFQKTKIRLEGALVKGTGEDWSTQLESLTRKRQTHTVAIPPDMLHKVVMNHRNAGSVVEVRPIIYHPHLVTGTKDNFRSHGLACNIGTSSKFHGFKDGVNLAVTIACDIYIPCAIAISPTNKTIYIVGAKTPHTMGGDGRLCIGNSRFEDYASLDSMAMSRQVSVINLFSLAGSPIEFMGETIGLAEVINDDTIVKVEEESRWNVR